jgi:DNA-binding response OmpR family regulator
LVLDEDALTLELYARELCQDYQVYTSDNLTETRRLLHDLRLDLVVVEPAVENDAGWELLLDIQNSAHPPAVILCSVEDERRAGLGQGAQAYLVKPVLPVTLHALVDRIVLSRTNKPMIEQSGSAV